MATQNKGIEKIMVSFRVDTDKLELLRSLYDSLSTTDIFNRLIDEKIESDFGSTEVRQPICAIGGKNNIASKIISMIPPHRTYIEPFGYSAAVLLRKSPSQVEVYNDINSEIVNFYRILKDNPIALYNRCNTIYSEKMHKDLKESAPEDMISQAARFFYLNRTSILGRGSFHHSTYTNKRNPSKIYKNITSRFFAISKRLHDVQILERDFRKIINKYINDKDAFIMCDPPYLGTDHYYSTEFKLEDHNDLAKLLHKFKGRYLVCHYSNQDINKLYADCYKTTMRVTISPAKAILDEDSILKKPKETLCLFTNYDLT